MKKKVNQEKKQELFKLLTGGAEENKKNIPIYFDGRQYSLKLPKKVMEEFNINTKKDHFKMSIILPQKHTGKNPELKLELIKNEE
jgi:hypothetical protein